ncbi:hypothetical protein [Solimonas terrae]|uniref:hypothetical protein n=1 Tax=Solimonas terrae TaxID=1396819 RepID=UPI00158336D3|nr:hypothetical protein [Solimonas terrae]
MTLNAMSTTAGRLHSSQNPCSVVLPVAFPYLAAGAHVGTRRAPFKFMVSPLWLAADEYSSAIARMVRPERITPLSRRQRIIADLFQDKPPFAMEAHQLRNEVTALQARFDALRGYL